MRTAGAMAANLSPHSKMSIDDMPLDQRKYICTMIDYSIHEGNGHWDMLVSELGFSERDNKNFRLAFPKGQSPTENLLRECNYRNYKVAYILYVLKKVGLVSLAEKIMDDLADKYKYSTSQAGQFTDLGEHKSLGSDQSLSDSDKIGGLDTIHYSYEEIEKGTEYFAPHMKLGAGAFGKVYKVKLKHTLFACKVLTINNASPHFSIISKHQEHNDLRNELRYLAEYRHPNIIPLYGWSLDGKDPCLIYQYMKNGSLQDCLQLNGNRPLNWVQRVQIASDAATGLQFLHTIKEKPLIHGDIKTANILLDDAFGAKLGDFGLAREGPRSHVTGSYIKLNDEHTPGTVGYLAAEYLRGKKLSVKVDTYAFGVVMLELYTGRMAYSRKNKHEAPVLLRDFMANIANDSDTEEQAISLLYQNQTQEISPLPHGLALAFVRLALQCCHEKRQKRPSMSDVLKRLETLRGEVEDAMSGSDAHTSGSSNGSANMPGTYDRQSWNTGARQLSRTPVESVDKSSVQGHRDTVQPGVYLPDNLVNNFNHMTVNSPAYNPNAANVPPLIGEMNGDTFAQNAHHWFNNIAPSYGQLPPVPYPMLPNSPQGYFSYQNMPMHPLFQQAHYSSQYSNLYRGAQQPFVNPCNESDIMSNHKAGTHIAPSTPGNFSGPDSFSSIEYDSGPRAVPAYKDNLAATSSTDIASNPSLVHACDNTANRADNVPSGVKVNSVKAQLMEVISKADEGTDVSEIFEKLEKTNPYS